MEEFDLFHISCNDYPLDKALPLPGVTFYYLNATERGLAWVDDFLDSHKPAHAPFRRRTFFSFGKIQHCLPFLNQINCNNGTHKIYRVNMTNPVKAPMVLTDCLRKKGISNTSNEQIANEYWNPQHAWKYWEYLSEEMIIVEDITTYALGLPRNGMGHYWDDQNLRKELFNC